MSDDVRSILTAAEWRRSLGLPMDEETISEMSADEFREYQKRQTGANALLPVDSAARARSVSDRAKSMCRKCGKKMARCECLELQFLGQVKHAGLPEPLREHRFHPSRMWRFDFAWPALKLAVEVEGGTGMAGRHQQMEGYENDCEKYGEATVLRWDVVRVTSRMIKDGRALLLVERVLDVI